MSPDIARRIAADAFVSGIFYDGKDLRYFRRWTHNTPVEVLVTLEVGDPPTFDGGDMRRLRQPLQDPRTITSSPTAGAAPHRPPT